MHEGRAVEPSDREGQQSSLQPVSDGTELRRRLVEALAMEPSAKHAARRFSHSSPPLCAPAVIARPGSGHTSPKPRTALPSAAIPERPRERLREPRGRSGHGSETLPSISRSTPARSERGGPRASGSGACATDRRGRLQAAESVGTRGTWRRQRQAERQQTRRQRVDALRPTRLNPHALRWRRRRRYKRRWQHLAREGVAYLSDGRGGLRLRGPIGLRGLGLRGPMGLRSWWGEGPR